MVVQTQEKDVNVLLDIGRKGVILIIGLVIHDVETHHQEEHGKIELEDYKKKGDNISLTTTRSSRASLQNWDKTNHMHNKREE